MVTGLDAFAGDDEAMDNTSISAASSHVLDAVYSGPVYQGDIRRSLKVEWNPVEPVLCLRYLVLTSLETTRIVVRLPGALE